MSSIDRRVVEMEFDNKQFEAGIKDTLNSLEALKEGLKLEGATKGLTDLSAAADNTRLDGIANGVDNISSKFSALGAIGFTIIQNLTNSALDFAKRLGGRILDPLIGGGRRRAENIEQAKFQFRGLGMDIEATMASALEAVRGTAFGLDEAAKTAGQLGASGMKAGEDMTTALRAISGVAAMTNSSYSDIADIFTKVSGNGRVMGDDLLRMSSRGLNAAATLAKAMNISEAEVREMVTKGKVDFETFYRAMDDAFGENATKANETFAGSLANLRAAFSRIGARAFTPWLEQQRDVFNALAPAVDSLGEVLKPVTDQLTNFTGRISVGLVRAINSLDLSKLNKIFSPIVGTFKNLFQLFKQVRGIVRDAFRNIFPPMTLDQINGILRGIMAFTASLKMGAETASRFEKILGGVFAIFGIGWELIKGLSKFLLGLFGMVTNGNSSFLDLAASVGEFLINLHWAIKEGEGLSNFFRGLLNVLRAPIEIIKQLAGALLGLFDFSLPNGSVWSQSFEPLSAIGDGILRVWSNILSLLGNVWNAFKNLGRQVADFLSPITTILADVVKNLEFSEVIDLLQTGLMGGIFLMIRRFADNLSNSFGSIQYNLTEPFKKLTFALSTMQTTLRAMTLMQIAIAVGLLAGSVVLLSQVDAAGLTKALSAITVMFAQLMVSLKAMSAIGGTPGIIGIGIGLTFLAVAIRILTGAVKNLAYLEWEELAKGLVGVTVLILGLSVAAKAMQGASGGMIRSGAGLLILAFGIKVLVGAVTDLAGLSWEEMARGLVGVGALLASLAIFTRLVDANKGGIAQGAGLLLLAFGIKKLADATVIFAALSWGEIGKGLASIGAILLAFAGFTRAMGSPAKLIQAGISLILIGQAMKVLGEAVGVFAGYSWEELGKGLASMGAALLAISIALNVMPKDTLAKAAGLVAIGLAMKLLASALGEMGGMSWLEIAKGLTALGGSLIIIALAVNVMSGALGGAAALLIVAGALAIFVPVLKTLGNMSIKEIATGLGALAAVFVVLGVAALVLTPLVPTLLGLGAAIFLIGAAVGAIGAGIFLFATGLGLLAAAGAGATAALVAMGAGIIGMIPLLAETLAGALVIFVQTIASMAPELFVALTEILKTVADAIIQNTPVILNVFAFLVMQLLQRMVKLIPAMANAALQVMLGVLKAVRANAPKIVTEIIGLVVDMLKALADGVPKFVAAAVNLMVAFLKSLEKELPKVITAGTDVIIALLEGISKNMVRIAEAGMKAVIEFIDGVANAIRRNTSALQAAGRNLAGAIIDGLTGGLASKVGEVARKAREVASKAISSAKNALGIRSPSRVFTEIGLQIGDGLVLGLQGSTVVVSRAAQRLSDRAIKNVQDSLRRLRDEMEVDSEMNPTIRPVLDLSDIRRGKSEMMNLLPNDPRLAIQTAVNFARRASAAHQAAQQNQRDVMLPVTNPVPVINYTQNNNSPRSLSSEEIYRQTRNQLSRTRGALTP